MQGRVSPYILGGWGVARLTSTAQFTYTSGPLPDGSTPTPGADVTDQLETAGYFTAPAASNAFMFTLGGGVDFPVAQHWAVDVGYRFSRFNATTPLNAQGATFGFGYRF
jgi:opacity protein-like surface antigen